MKIKNLLTLLIVLVVLLIACKKNGTGDAPAKKLKYLTQVITLNGTTTYFTNFTYDDKKRLTTIKTGGTITYTYNGDNVIGIEESYPGFRHVSELAYADGKLQTMSVKTYSNTSNTITMEHLNSYVYNGDKLTEWHQDGHVIFFYYDNNNNVIKQQGEGYALNYSYDNKKSKFANLPPAFKGIGIQLNNLEYFSQNNIIAIDRGVNGITSWTYSYDSDGYPTGAVAVTNVNNTTNTTKYSYEYTEL